jgi:hypothetical protein
MVVSPSKSYVTDALAKGAGKATAKPAANIKTLVGKQNDKQSLWFAAMNTKELRQAAGANDKAKEVADKIESLSGGVDVTNDVKLRQQLEGVKALGIFFITSNEQLKDIAPTLTDILNSIKLNQAETNVTLEMVVSGDAIEKAMKLK